MEVNTLFALIKTPPQTFMSFWPSLYTIRTTCRYPFITVNSFGSPVNTIEPNQVAISQYLFLLSQYRTRHIQNRPWILLCNWWSPIKWVTSWNKNMIGCIRLRICRELLTSKKITTSLILWIENIIIGAYWISIFETRECESQFQQFFTRLKSQKVMIFDLFLKKAEKQKLKWTWWKKVVRQASSNMELL